MYRQTMADVVIHLLLLGTMDTLMSDTWLYRTETIDTHRHAGRSLGATPASPPAPLPQPPSHLALAATFGAEKKAGEG